jgi:hypothetical protein
MGGFPKTSVFGKATLDFEEKAAFKTLFPELFPKLTEFWKKLMGQVVLHDSEADAHGAYQDGGRAGLPGPGVPGGACPE